ncbi:hypothetical protein M8J75_004215 [Diaphorina citri]|nr:hypothetical protein M8J75_004215 [Diaphorina citri]
MGSSGFSAGFHTPLKGLPNTLENPWRISNGVKSLDYPYTESFSVSPDVVVVEVGNSVTAKICLVSKQYAADKVEHGCYLDQNPTAEL